MVTQIIMNRENLQKVLEGCKDYAENNSVSEDEKREYLASISTHENDWGIVATGVFHDAFGEIVKWDAISVYVEDDY